MTETKVISIINQKGGVGKTTTTANLAYALSKMGKKVLAVDFDQQASLTNYLNYGLDGEYYYSIYELLIKIFRDISPAEDECLSKASLPELIGQTIVRPTYLTRELVTDEEGKKKVVNAQKEFGFDLLPASIELADFELELSQSRQFNKKAYYLDALIGEITDCRDYDYVLIDCNPSLGVLTMNAIIAGLDGIIIPTNLDLMSTRGIMSLLGKVADTQKALYKATKGEVFHKGVIGIVMNLYSDKRVVDKTLSSDIDNFYPLYVFKSAIPDSAMAKRAVLEGVIYSMKFPKAEKAYDALASEILKRMHKMENDGQHVTYSFDSELRKVVTENLDTGEIEVVENAMSSKAKEE